MRHGEQEGVPEAGRHEGRPSRAELAASPCRRDAVPVLLFHGDLDLNVPVDHGQDLAKALRRAEKTVEYVEYENADHFLERERQRIDMLQRIADFLDEHLKKKAD